MTDGNRWEKLIKSAHFYLSLPRLYLGEMKLKRIRETKLNVLDAGNDFLQRSRKQKKLLENCLAYTNIRATITAVTSEFGNIREVSAEKRGKPVPHCFEMPMPGLNREHGSAGRIRNCHGWKGWKRENVSIGDLISLIIHLRFFVSRRCWY